MNRIHRIELILPLFFLFVIALSSCDPSPEEIREENIKKYHEQLENFKKDSLDLLEDKMKVLMATAEKLAAVNAVKAPSDNQSINVTIEDEYPSTYFNTLYVHDSYFMSPEDPDETYYVHIHLDQIRSLIAGKDPIWQEDDVAQSLIDLRKLRAFAKHFLAADKLAIIANLELQLPEFDPIKTEGDTDVFIPGVYKGHFALFEFKSKGDLIDNFVFAIESSEIESVAVNQGVEKELVENLFIEVRDYVQAELEIRFDVQGKVPYMDLTY